MPSVKLNFEEPTVKVLMLKGNDGFSPIVATHRNGTTVTVTITDANGEHVYEVEDGFSPVLTWSKVNGVTTVNVTSAAGTRSFEIHDGVDLTGGVPTNSVLAFDGSSSSVPNGYEVVSGGFATLDRVYPVGSIYMSVNSTSPATLFGGTWEQIKGRMLLAVDDQWKHLCTESADANNPRSFTLYGNATLRWGTGNTWYEKNFTAGTYTATNQTFDNIDPAFNVQKEVQICYAVGDYGGEMQHTLSIDEMPKTRFKIPHVFGYDSCAREGYTETRSGMSVQGAQDNTSNDGWHNLTTGSGYAHNNMPPYLVVYVWKRTA